MVDVLLDVDVILDICRPRLAFAAAALKALTRCQQSGGKMWIYTGSVLTLEYSLLKGLREDAWQAGQSMSEAQARFRARQLLKEFCADKHWLAALADEGAVFDSEDSENEQLLRALDRFKGKARLLSRDESLCQHYPDRVISPDCYLALELPPRPLDFIDLKAQQDAIRPALERNLHRVLHHGQYILGPEVRELEARLADYVGVEHCVTVASGTEALLISLMALGIEPSDEVITTPFTFVATAEVIVLLGATPVFVDIEPDTCNIDVRLIEAKITPKTKAILPVSLYGQPADMDEINAIAARHGLPVIEDAAQSFGANYKDRKSCNLSTIGCTSFFPSKPLGCYGDGGAIFTSDDNLAKACREIRVHGQSRRYVHTRIGVGGRMDTLQCAIVQAKLERFDWEIQRRLEIGARYNQLIDETGIPRVQQRPDCTSVFAQYTVFVDDREDVQARLKEAGIPTAVHYPIPLNEQPAYRHLCCSDCTPIASKVAKQVMSLPMSADLRLDKQQTIIQVLRGCMKTTLSTAESA